MTSNLTKPTIVDQSVPIPSANGEMKLLDIKNCENYQNNPITFDVSIENGTIKEGWMNFTQPINNQPMSFTVQKSRDGISYTNVGSVKGEGICQTIIKFMGQLWMDLASSAAVPNPTNCPLQKGSYRIHNLNFNLSRQRVFTTLIYGYVRTYVYLYNNNKKSKIGCVLLEIHSTK